MSVPQELIIILVLDLFFPSDESLQNGHEFRFFQLMGLLIEHFLNVGVFFD